MCTERSVEREYEIEKVEDKVEDKVESNVEINGENADQKEDERSLDSTIWPECSFLQEIDFTAYIGTNDTPIHNFAYQITDHIVEEEAPVNLNGDEKHINLEPSDGKINCIDLNADGDDHEVNLKPLSQEYYFDLNAEGGDDEVKLEPLSQENCFDLKSDGSENLFGLANEGEAFNTNCGENLFGLANEGEAFNTNCGSQSLQLSVSTTHIVNEDFCKAQSVDVTPVFTTDEVFHSKYALVDWCQSKARTIKTIVVTAKSDQGCGNKKPRVYLACERSGIYRNHRNEVTKVRKKRDSATRKCNCPFSLRGVNLGGDQWKVQVRCGLHNHELPNSLVGHPFAGRLSKEEKKFVAELSIAGVKPKDVLCGLKRRHEDNVSTMKTIYNAKSKMRIHEMEGRTAMQQLLKVLVAKHYVYWVRSDETTDEVLDLFWAHPDCILLAKCFPSVVIVDCTYKTNKYKMPLFAMVGITSTAKTFSIAHCFLYKEVDDNYQWALSKLRMLFEPHDIPKVFVTDREFAVINAFRRVFPDAQHMLCTFHIAKNVEQHCKPLFQSTSVWTKFFDDWQAVIKSTAEEEFFRRWGELQKDWSEFPKAVDYLARTWFKHREAFVLAWTNRIKHRGNRTTNRAEGSHGKLKKHLDNGIGTFTTVFTGMDNMLGLQINEVKAVFERSLGSVKDLHHGMLFKEIRGRLSHFALDVIKKERDRSIDIGLDPSACDHVVRTVYGLPCAHELLQYSRDHRPIPFAAIDVHWSKLTILPNIEKEDELLHMTEFVMLKKLYDQSTEDEKKIILRKVKNIATPSTTSLIEPTPIIPKGRPRGSKKKLSQKEKKHEVSTKRDPSGFEYAKTIEEQQLVASQLSEVSKGRKQIVKKKLRVDRSKWELQAYMHFIPEFMHPFIQNIEDVKGDGHCGYRCIAEHMGWFDDKGWERVRIDLIADLERYKEKYENAWGSWYYPDCLRALKVFESQCITEDHWMVMPDMGFLIASAYNSVLLLYSPQQCLTFFPHADPPPQGSALRVMAIAHVNKNHFVKIFLKDSAPIPHVAIKWNILRNEQSASWMMPFVDRITLFKELASCGLRRKDSTIMIN